MGVEAREGMNSKDNGCRDPSPVEGTSKSTNMWWLYICVCSCV